MSRRAGPPFVEATINYADPAADGGMMYDEAGGAVAQDPRTVRIHDGRRAGEPLALDRNGFQLVRCPVEVDFADGRQVAARYLPLMRSLVRQLTGASKVLMLGETVRSEGDTGRTQPAFGAHIDSDLQTLRGLVGVMHPDPQSLLERRFAMINLWRPLAPVERAPLALCDASTVSRRDLRPARISLGGPGTASAELAGYNVLYNPAHRWWWFPRMQPDEALVFKLADSDPDAVQFTAHSAFEPPDADPAAPPRRSMELRMVAFFD